VLFDTNRAYDCERRTISRLLSLSWGLHWVMLRRRSQLGCWSAYFLCKTRQPNTHAPWRTCPCAYPQVWTRWVWTEGDVLSEQTHVFLFSQARETATPMRRWVAGQIEYWATLGRIAEAFSLIMSEAREAISLYDVRQTTGVFAAEPLDIERVSWTASNQVAEFSKTWFDPAVCRYSSRMSQ
jgi:hypothetical protein